MSQYFSRKGGAALIYLTNPPVNGLAHKVRTSLLKDLDRAIKEKAPAVVLMGAGGHFSAGADIVEFARGGHRTSPSLTEVIDYMDSYNTPLIASVHGSALGGGLETALACHWRVSNLSAVFGLPEVKLGILPGAFKRHISFTSILHRGRILQR
jgi:3-hydroxyacyl-CoA dehydrogenase